MSAMTPTIFRAYDVRGTYPDQLNRGVVEALGQAIGTYAKQQGQSTVVTARDGRLSGPDLQDALNQPSLIARIAASFIFSGVSKSGSPAPNPITSLPAAFISLALEVTAIVGEGFIRFKLLETILIRFYNILILIT